MEKDTLNTNESPENKSLIKNVKIGLHNPNFKMTEPVFSKSVNGDVLGKRVVFNISAGPLIFQGKPLKETFVLEIDYSHSEESHRLNMTGDGFGSHLYAAFGTKANEIALDLIKEQAWTLNDHINSWPEFQAIITISSHKNIIKDTNKNAANTLLG